MIRISAILSKTNATSKTNRLHIYWNQAFIFYYTNNANLKKQERTFYEDVVLRSSLIENPPSFPGQSGRAHPIPDGGVHGLPGGCLGTSHPLQVLQSTVGRVLAGVGHHVFL